MAEDEQVKQTNIKTEITQEMKRAYLDYAMSVIVSRALPDVKDGLKPVHRRILYAMYKTGLISGGRYSKSAKVVGEVLGKYHPHGDAPVYESLVRMAQDFSMRYPLIKGQGNFGSIDGDPAAAMRYTEVKLTKLSEEIIQDIEKGTVEFVDNFDGSLQEPTFLPAKVPNLLLMGAEGIAVGKGKTAIIIKELPYQVNKAVLVEKIARLVIDKKIVGISDLRDESSDRDGIRVVIELKRDAAYRKVLNNLYKFTDLQTTFPVNTVALV